MDIGILGLGGVGKSFIKLLSQYGKRDDRIFGYDVQEVDLGEYDGKIELVESEEALGEQSDFLICCTDMLAGDGLRYAAAQMRPGTVVCDDFSAKTPAYDAIKESGALEKGVAYWSFHTMFSPKMGFDGQTVLDIPVSGCYTNGTIHPYIERTRQMIAQAGSKFKRIWSVPEHDMMTGRIQASVSAQNICTAKTLAGLGINPLEGNETYSGSLDINNFLMALRAIGPPGSSNHSVYGLIAMKNPYSMQNLDSYVKAYKTLIAVASESKNDAIDILKETREKLGWDRVGLAGKGWDDTFGEVGPTMNSFSSHLAEAIAWSESDAPVDVFQAIASPPYTMRALMAFRALCMPHICVDNMIEGGTHDDDFLKTLTNYHDWAQRAALGGEWEDVDKGGELFFNPVRQEYPELIDGIVPRTNEIIGLLKASE